MLQSLSPRLVFIGLVLVAIFSMAFARFYLQEYLGLGGRP